jgi:hypothetical protein
VMGDDSFIVVQTTALKTRISVCVQLKAGVFSRR